MFNASVIYIYIYINIACHHFCTKCSDGSNNIVEEGEAGCQECKATANLIDTYGKCECPLASGFFEHAHVNGVTCDRT